jgi:hypothetical protein
MQVRPRTSGHQSRRDARAEGEVRTPLTQQDPDVRSRQPAVNQLARLPLAPTWAVSRLIELRAVRRSTGATVTTRSVVLVGGPRVAARAH